MIDTLDSRALRLTDCYGQRFMKVGAFPYNVLPAHGDSITEERPFTVKVKERTTKAKMQQHTVTVRCRAGKFSVEPVVVLIEDGDLVMWNCPDANSTPYLVVGDKGFFASHRLVNESGFSHAFGMAGEYRWMDAYGSGAAGVVRVKDPSCKEPAEFQRWRKALAEGTLVMVTDGKAEPREVDIVTGQTVFFAIGKGPGISITDERLLTSKGDSKPDGITGRSKAKR